MNATNLLKQLPKKLWHHLILWRHRLWRHRLMTSIGATRLTWKSCTDSRHHRRIQGFPCVGGCRGVGAPNPGDVKCRGRCTNFSRKLRENEKKLDWEGGHVPCAPKSTTGRCRLTKHPCAVKFLTLNLWLLVLLPSDIDWRISQVLVSTREHTVHEVSSQGYHDDTVSPQRFLIDLWLIFDWFSWGEIPFQPWS